LFVFTFYLICHYFVVLLFSVLMVASIDGHLPFLAACHCSSLLLLKLVIVFTWQINSLSLCLSLSLGYYCYLYRYWAYLLTDAVNGRFANMLSTDSRLAYIAKLSTPYTDTTGMCLELYYQLKSTDDSQNPELIGLHVRLIDEEIRPRLVASTDRDNRTYWDRMFVKLPAGIHRIRIEGRRSFSHYWGMSIDDVVVQPCHRFG